MGHCADDADEVSNIHPLHLVLVQIESNFMLLAYKNKNVKKRG